MPLSSERKAFAMTDYEDGGDDVSADEEPAAARLRFWRHPEFRKRALVAVLAVVTVVVAAQRVFGADAGAAVAAAPPPQRSQSSSIYLNTAESLGDVYDMLLSLGVEEYFPTLRNQGFTNLYVIGGSTTVPMGVKQFHWKVIRKEALALAQPDGADDRIRNSNVADEIPEATQQQLSRTICKSWAGTEGIHRFMATHRRYEKSTYVPLVIPACKGSFALEPHGVLFGQSKEDAVATTVANDEGWNKNTLTKLQVQQLRKRGVVNQLVFDHELKIMYCGIPKASALLLKAWLLRSAGAWNKQMKSNETSAAFNGPRIRSGAVLSDSEVQRYINSGGYFKFTFVRDPFTRVLAAFHERVHECPQKRSPAECRSWLRTLLGVTARRSKLEGFTFRQFVLYLEKLKDTKQEHEDVTYQTAHWMTQTDVCGLDQFVYDFIGRVESDDIDTQLLYDIVGFQGMTARQRRSFDPSQDTRNKLFHYGEDSDSVQKNVLSINKIYERDLKLLGYRGESLFSYLSGGVST
ncbi:hypothetical protein DIPPA_26446 [Diplonema papillatum]|nr:hypothetical protein DIPPA_26446 [Diplonema papillatum]